MSKLVTRPFVIILNALIVVGPGRNNIQHGKYAVVRLVARPLPVTRLLSSQRVDAVATDNVTKRHSVLPADAGPQTESCSDGLVTRGIQPDLTACA